MTTRRKPTPPTRPVNLTEEQASDPWWLLTEIEQDSATVTKKKAARLKRKVSALRRSFTARKP